MEFIHRHRLRFIYNAFNWSTDNVAAMRHLKYCSEALLVLIQLILVLGARNTASAWAKQRSTNCAESESCGVQTVNV